MGHHLRSLPFALACALAAAAGVAHAAYLGPTLASVACDGVRDDGPAINAAIAAGAPFTLPAGRCLIGQTLAMTRAAAHGLVWGGRGATAADGSGAGKTVLVPAAGVTPAILIDGTPFGGYLQSWGVENLTIDLANQPDTAASIAIEQVQAFDGSEQHVRVLNYGSHKLSWLFKAGAYTTTVAHSAGGIVSFSGVSASNAATTILFEDDDIISVGGAFYQNATFNGGAIQSPYVAGITPMIYLPPGVAPYAFTPNTTGIYAAVIGDIENSLQFTSVGTDWEVGSPIPATCSVAGWAYGTYNDGTHGCLEAIPVLKVGASAVNSTFINPTFAGMYLLDYGGNTRVIGQGAGGFGVDIHNGASFENYSLGVGGTVFGYTNLADYLDFGTTTTWSIAAPSGEATFRDLYLRPAAEGLLAEFVSAAGVGVGYLSTNGSGVGGLLPTLSWSGQVAPYTLQLRPNTDQTGVLLVQNAAGAQAINCGTAATLSSARCSFGSGFGAYWYSDAGFATQTAAINGATGEADFGFAHLSGALYLGTGAAPQSSSGLLTGAGNPASGLGNAGDFYFRIDCTHGSSDCLWHKEGAAWADVN